MAIGAIVAWPSVRRIMRTVMVPVQMEDLKVTIAAYAGPEMDGLDSGSAAFASWDHTASEML